MINPKQITAQLDGNISQADKLHQVEDAALKTMAQFFKDELLPYFDIEGEVDHIAPTEIVHLELKKFYQDFNFVMKDGSWIHFEFQSSDTKALEDLKRFRCYEALVSYQHKVDVHTYVLFSGNIETPMTEYTSGYNTYRVHPIIMKGRLAEEVFDNINYKLEHSTNQRRFYTTHAMSSYGWKNIPKGTISQRIWNYPFYQKSYRKF